MPAQLPDRISAAGHNQEPPAATTFGSASQVAALASLMPPRRIMLDANLDAENIRQEVIRAVKAERAEKRKEHGSKSALVFRRRATTVGHDASLPEAACA